MRRGGVRWGGVRKEEEWRWGGVGWGAGGRRKEGWVWGGVGSRRRKGWSGVGWSGVGWGGVWEGVGWEAGGRQAGGQAEGQAGRGQGGRGQAGRGQTRGQVWGRRLGQGPGQRGGQRAGMGQGAGRGPTCMCGCGRVAGTCAYALCCKGRCVCVCRAVGGAVGFPLAATSLRPPSSSCPPSTPLPSPPAAHLKSEALSQLDDVEADIRRIKEQLQVRVCGVWCGVWGEGGGWGGGRVCVRGERVCLCGEEGTTAPFPPSLHPPSTDIGNNASPMLLYLATPSLLK